MSHTQLGSEEEGGTTGSEQEKAREGAKNTQRSF